MLKNKNMKHPVHDYNHGVVICSKRLCCLAYPPIGSYPIVRANDGVTGHDHLSTRCHLPHLHEGSHLNIYGHTWSYNDKEVCQIDDELPFKWMTNLPIWLNPKEKERLNKLNIIEK